MSPIQSKPPPVVGCGMEIAPILVMQHCNILRIDPTDGSSVIEYRIDGEHVESRLVRPDEENEWKRLTAQQLTSHVLGNTPLAYWLRRKMGVHKLIRACSKDSSGIEFSRELIAA
jgi:hypothetical protein